MRIGILEIHGTANLNLRIQGSIVGEAQGSGRDLGENTVGTILEFTVIDGGVPGPLIGGCLFEINIDFLLEFGTNLAPFFLQKSVKITKK